MYPCLRIPRGLLTTITLLLTGILLTACGSGHKTTSTSTTTSGTGDSGSPTTASTATSATKPAPPSKAKKAPGASTTNYAAVPTYNGTSQPRPAGSLQSIFEAENITTSSTNPLAGFQTLRALGANRVRIYMNWSNIAPASGSTHQPHFDAANPAAYPTASWAPYDRDDRASAATHVPILVTIGGGAPDWAEGSGIASGQPYPGGSWKISAADFGAFVRALGTRYSGHYTPPGQSTPLPRIDFWSIWNEPNAGTYLAPQSSNQGSVPTGPVLYRKLVDAAWSALGATGHGPSSDTVLLGENAPVANTLTPGIYSTTTPMRFIRELYCLDSGYKPLTGSAATAASCPSSPATFVSQNPALFQAAGWSDHPYEGAASPTTKTPGPAGVGAADFANLENIVTGLSDAAKAYGSGHNLPIYSTEFGYNTYQLSDALAAKYLNESEYLSWLNPSIKSFGQYLLNDPAPGQGNFKTGLESSTGSPKPDVYDAYVMPLWIPVTSTTRGGELRVWGCARPSVYQHPSGTTVAIQFATGASFKTIASVPIKPAVDGCYFDTTVKIPSSGNVRLLYAGSSGALTSRVQPVTAG